MDENYRSILGEGPFPFSLESPQDTTRIYTEGRLMIIVTPNAYYSGTATHAHSSYEFTIPYNDVVPCKVGMKRMVMEKARLFPFNPEQDHGPLEPMKGINLTGIMIEKEFLQAISSEMYGRGNVIFLNDNYRYSNDLLKAINNFIKESDSHLPGSRFIQESLAVMVAVDLLRHIKSNMPIAVKERNYTEKKNINRAVDYIIGCYDTDYSLADIARVANLSPYHFIRVFKTEMGSTPYDFYINIKVEKACELLKDQERTIAEVCYECGFNNPSYFTTVFKKRMGVSPSEYRKCLQG